MNNYNLSLVLIFFITINLTSSCGVFQVVAVDTTASLLSEASKEIESETNLEMFKNGLPANLKQMEGLLYLSPNNEKLLVSLIKGYAAYSFVVLETEMMDAQLKGDDDNPQVKEQLIINYTKAFRYGLRLLKKNGVSYTDLIKASNNTNGIVSLLDSKLGTGNDLYFEGVLFIAQSLGGLVLSQKDRMDMISQLPIVKSMFDWVCIKKPNINFGACDIFYGIYEAGRPRMLGGDPEKGKEIFLSFIKNNPNNWLGRTAYIRFYLLPMLDEDGYNDQKFYLEKMSELFRQSKSWKVNRDWPLEMKNEGLRLYQSVAIRRFEIIKNNEEEIF